MHLTTYIQIRGRWYTFAQSDPDIRQYQEDGWRWFVWPYPGTKKKLMDEDGGEEQLAVWASIVEQVRCDERKRNYDSR